MYESRALPQVNVRMPVEVKEKLQESAQNAFRSLNSEIVLRLTQSLQKNETQNA